MYIFYYHNFLLSGTVSTFSILAASGFRRPCGFGDFKDFSGFEVQGLQGFRQLQLLQLRDATWWNLNDARTQSFLGLVLCNWEEVWLRPSLQGSSHNFQWLLNLVVWRNLGDRVEIYECFSVIRCSLELLIKSLNREFLGVNYINHLFSQSVLKNFSIFFMLRVYFCKRIFTKLVFIHKIIYI